jgi:imidazolonepropionase
MTTATLLVEHAAELATLAGSASARRGAAQADVGSVRDAAVAADAHGRIVAVGTSDEVRAAVRLAPDAIVLDASERAVLPAFVDPHTHAVFGGDRADEFARRLAGEDYLAILAQGGGILSTVRATRDSDEASLARRASAALQRMLLHGTTTVEIKSGYGLDTQSEVRLLRVAQAVGGTFAPRTVGTLLAAHAVPPEYAGDADGYVSLVCEEIIPEVARQGLARFCDVFAEKGVFSVDQARRVLETGLAHGLRPKLHAEQKSLLGGTRLAAELRAASVDHLEHADEDSLQALANARDTVAVLLPGAAFMLRETRDAPARRMIELGVPVALATDYNPGTSPILSMPLAIGLACLRLGLSPAEALVAATINAAHAVCLADEVGSLEVGKRADMLILDASSHAHLPYHFGTNLVRTVIQDGRVVAHAGEVLG